MEEISARWFVQSVRKWLNRKGLTLKYKKAPRGAKRLYGSPVKRDQHAAF